MKLYEISDQFLHLKHLIDDLNIDPESLEDALKEVNEDFEQKINAVLMAKKIIEAQQLVLMNETERMTDLINQCKKSSDSLENYIRDNMIKVGKEKIDLPLFKVTLKAATKAVFVEDEKSIPVKYWISIPASQQLDKRTLLADLKLSAVSGAKLQDGKRALLIK